MLKNKMCNDFFNAYSFCWEMNVSQLLISSSGIQVKMCMWNTLFWFHVILIAEHPLFFIIGV